MFPTTVIFILAAIVFIFKHFSDGRTAATSPSHFGCRSHLHDSLMSGSLLVDMRVFRVQNNLRIIFLKLLIVRVRQLEKLLVGQIVGL